jgi:hypothetical protein
MSENDLDFNKIFAKKSYFESDLNRKKKNLIKKKL